MLINEFLGSRETQYLNCTCFHSLFMLFLNCRMMQFHRKQYFGIIWQQKWNSVFKQQTFHGLECIMRWCCNTVYSKNGPIIETGIWPPSYQDCLVQFICIWYNQMECMLTSFHAWSTVWSSYTSYITVWMIVTEVHHSALLFFENNKDYL